MSGNAAIQTGLTRWARHVLAIIVLGLLATAGFIAARVGLSRLMAEYGTAASSLPATEAALRFDRIDPEAHYAHAVQLARLGRQIEAVAEFDSAAKLRPQDYFFWQELGRACEEAGDIDAAIKALRQATEVAPSYSRPHWLLGNLLLRANHADEGFKEMRLAVTTDASLFPTLIDLAWVVYGADAALVVRAIQPDSDKQRMAIGAYFITHNQLEEGLKLLKSVGGISVEHQRAVMTDLIRQHKFVEAHEMQNQLAAPGDENPRIPDPGFESAGKEETAFGWKIVSRQGIGVALDTSERHSGKQSLRIEYSGNLDPNQPVVSQLILVAPHTRYRLTFMARTENLMSAALPAVSVMDADTQRILAQSQPLPSGNVSWNPRWVEFETTETPAIIVEVRREQCTSQPCPIFGRLWFDDWSIETLKPFASTFKPISRQLKSSHII